jgi:hypothetical protein
MEGLGQGMPKGRMLRNGGRVCTVHVRWDALTGEIQHCTDRAFWLIGAFFLWERVGKQARQASRTVFGFSRLDLRCGRIYWFGGCV